jgi:hypothetical protein
MSEVPDPDNRPINFRSQQDFRRQLIVWRERCE